MGQDIRALAAAVKNDLRNGKKIAIGLEAPMWQPAPREIPNEAFDLFSIRFDQEQGFAWYLQSGAAATAKSLSIGRLLFSLLDIAPTDFRPATIANEQANVELFEGFVAGRWKLPGEQHFDNGAHAWDALTTAVAFHYAQCNQEKDPRLSLIHASGTYPSPILSHWQTILESEEFDASQCNSDCLVVGFDSMNVHVKEVATTNWNRPAAS